MEIESLLLFVVFVRRGMLGSANLSWRTVAFRLSDFIFPVGTLSSHPQASENKEELLDVANLFSSFQL